MKTFDPNAVDDFDSWLLDEVQPDEDHSTWSGIRVRQQRDEEPSGEFGIRSLLEFPEAAPGARNLWQDETQRARASQRARARGRRTIARAA